MLVLRPETLACPSLMPRQRVEVIRRTARRNWSVPRAHRAWFLGAVQDLVLCEQQQTFRPLRGWRSPHEIHKKRFQENAD